MTTTREVLERVAERIGKLADEESGTLSDPTLLVHYRYQHANRRDAFLVAREIVLAAIPAEPAHVEPLRCRFCKRVCTETLDGKCQECARPESPIVEREIVRRALLAGRGVEPAPAPPSEGDVREAAREVHVIFDGPPSHESGRFVECEDATADVYDLRDAPPGFTGVAPARRSGDEVIARLTAAEAEVERLRAERPGDGLANAGWECVRPGCDGTTKHHGDGCDGTSERCGCPPCPRAGQAERPEAGMRELIREVLDMGGTPDLFAPKGGWHDWMSRANGVLATPPKED